MADQLCVVCSRQVDDAGGYLELNAGGYFLFGFATDKVAAELWIHYRCLRKKESAEHVEEA